MRKKDPDDGTAPLVRMHAPPSFEDATIYKKLTLKVALGPQIADR